MSRTGIKETKAVSRKIYTDEVQSPKEIISPGESFWRHKTVAITGGCGTIGRGLIDALLATDCTRIISIDHAEYEIARAAEMMSREDRIAWLYGDVRDPQRLTDAFRGADVIIHAAALKHLWVCEQTPNDALQTNVLAVKNVIEAACAVGAERIMFTSSDKAVNPTSILGTSKLLGERMMSAANANTGPNGPVFSSVRFGNVLGSRGSVLEVFSKQIMNGGPVTLTDPRMTRFMMSLSNAVELVLNATAKARGGEVIVSKMPAMKVADLADVLIAELGPRFGFIPGGISIEVVGARPGEKLYEELINEEEARRSLEAGNHIVVVPAMAHSSEILWGEDQMNGCPKFGRCYNSSVENNLGPDEIFEYLREFGLLNAEGLKGQEVTAQGLAEPPYLSLASNNLA